MHLDGDGANVLVHAPHAWAVDLCLLGPGGEHRLGLHRGRWGRWFGRVPGMAAGQAYGLRVHGPWDPARGQLHNPHKLLLDPYARGIQGEVRLGPASFGVTVDEKWQPLRGHRRNDRDSAGAMPHSVLLPQREPAAGFTGPPAGHRVIYEAHVRGLTLTLPGVPEQLRGTYAGLAHPATVAHLRQLGITTIELLPIHAKADEPALVRRALSNYWGYNTLSFFAPEPSYATAASRTAGAGAVVDEVAQMVADLHAAGLEVVLDVVYNHTAEGDKYGPVYSWRGLDNRGYYLHRGSRYRHYEDVTGCGNSLDFRHRAVVGMVLDSLRYWREQIGVDGFRFDLATTLGRRGHGFDADHPLWVALATDPVLAGTLLIAEPWDVGPGGWRTGSFPAPMSEWNDLYRDTLRRFWVADAGALHAGGAGHDLRELGTRLAGSADLFADGPEGRGPLASINYVTAHDGFTLADLVSYDTTHNEANGEYGQDGAGQNLSWNHGQEGRSTNPTVATLRRRTMRNLIGTLLVSGGVPMLTAGDEIGRSQQGNNNAYCQDNPTSWIDWTLAPWQEDLRATVAHLTRLRRHLPALRPARFHQPEDGAGAATLRWFDEDGQAMTPGRWHDPHRRVLQLLLADGPSQQRVLVVLNGAANSVQVTLTGAGPAEYDLVWDSVWERPQEAVPGARAGSECAMVSLSMRIYRGR